MHFQPRALPTLAAALGVVLLIGLGCWQLHRHQERNAGRVEAITHVGSPPLTTLDGAGPWRQVHLAGLLPPPDVLLGSGVVQGGAPGYEVYGVFCDDPCPDRCCALVDRGWLPADRIEELLTRLPSGPAEVKGQTQPLTGDPDVQPIARRGSAQVYAPGGTAGMAKAAQAVALVLAPEPAIAGLARQPLRVPAAIPAQDDTSLSYAIQWFAIAAILTATWAWASTRRP